jgi:hypothetical protein
MKAFVLTVRHSGLRIGDTIALKRERIKGNKLFLYTQKTGTPVLPPAAVAALGKLSGDGEYSFASGKGEAADRAGELVAVSRHSVRGREGPRRAFASVPRHVRSVVVGGRRIDRVRVGAARPFVGADHGAARHYEPWVKTLQKKSTRGRIDRAPREVPARWSGSFSQARAAGESASTIAKEGG